MTAPRAARRRVVAVTMTSIAALWCLALFVPALHPMFSLVCHQIPERSFTVGGVTLSVCARCTGLYAGFLLGSIALIISLRLRPGLAESPPGRAILLMAAIPALIEGGGEIAGLWAGIPAGRALTGLLFGVVIPFYFIPATDEMFTEARAEVSRLLIKLEKAHAITRAR